MSNYNMVVFGCAPNKIEVSTPDADEYKVITLRLKEKHGIRYGNEAEWLGIPIAGSAGDSVAHRLGVHPLLDVGKAIEAMIELDRRTEAEAQWEAFRAACLAEGVTVPPGELLFVADYA